MSKINKLKKFFFDNKQYRIIKQFKKNGNIISYDATVNNKTILEGCNKIGNVDISNTTIGFGTYILSGRIVCSKIGKYCSIGNDVRVISDTHPINFVSTHPGFFDSRDHMFPSSSNYFDDILKTENDFMVEIGNDVWIGQHVLLKGGIKIGNGAVIGMGAVVTKDVPPYSIVCGCPAKIIKYRFTSEIIAKLQQTCWWDWPAEKIKKLKNDFNDINKFLNMD